MTTFTENYNLIKPGEEDYYDVTDFNENFDTLDTAIATAEAEIDGVNEKIGNSTDADSGTIFGKLNTIVSSVVQGTSVIKSIQHVTYTNPTGSEGAELSINTVDPAKCFVLLERLYDASSTKISYTLNQNSVVLTHDGAVVGKLSLGFWIIEFY
ncbi:MAG: hypothetical protein IJY52_08610 [Anaerotignum sp.]|nr:hypothetical protein [Anaerotignum sp.]